MGEALVPDSVGLIGGRTELPVAEFLVLREVALEPAHLAVALEGQHVGGDPVQEPAIVADHDHAARERLETSFERPERVHVEIVRGFVQQQDVAPGT